MNSIHCHRHSPIVDTTDIPYPTVHRSFIRTLGKHYIHDHGPPKEKGRWYLADYLKDYSLGSALETHNFYM